MTHAELVQRAVRWLRNTQRCKIAYAELDTALGEVPDAIGWRPFLQGSIVVECKASRSDLRANVKKTVERLGYGVGDLRYFLTPPGLVPKPAAVADLAGDDWGLIEVHKRAVRIVRPATRRPADPQRLLREQAMLLAALRRHELGVPFNSAQRRFAPYGRP